MAYFSARMKLLFSSEGVSLGLDSKDPFRHGLFSAFGGSYVGGLRSVRLRKSRMRSNEFSTRVYSSSSSKKKKSWDLDDAEKNHGLHEDEDEDEDDDVFDGDDGGFGTDELACFRGLVLDISYRPINVVCWKRAICLEFMEKADVLEYYDRTVNSPTGSFYIPAVLRVPHLLQVVKRRRVKNSLSRKNILLRDDYTCQYCSSRENLTIDHVLPISRGGEWKWENLVAACARCNSKKGQKTLEEANVKLLKAPKVPKDYDILAIPLTSSAIQLLRSRNGMPQEWRQYLGLGKPHPL